MRIDIHIHCNSTDPDEIDAFAQRCINRDTIGCIFSVGPRTDHHFFCTNEQTMAAARRHPKILIPFAFVDLWDQVDRGCVVAYADAGFRGLKCMSPYYAYDHDEYMPVYEEAERLNLPIVFHTGAFRPNDKDPVHRRPLLANQQPLTIDRIARSFPRLKIVMAHMGTRFFRHDAAELMRMHPNVYADLAGMGSWGAVEPAELVQLLGQPMYHVDATFAGFKKLLLGSDGYITIPHPFEMAQPAYEHLLRRVGVPEDIQRDIFGGTAAKWLGLNG